MIRNVNSGLVLDGSDFVVRVAPLVGTYTQLWIFNKSTENPEAIIFTNVANGRALYSWPYTKSVFCYDWADTVYTRWFVEGDRRLVPAAYPQEFLYYGYGPLAISLRYGVSSDGTDEWVLVESKENSET
ncbi:unnamed protein product [Phaedon cochleariae]|uniref:Uncharacterized protein n=1 Tax=Phaedon cochleariae TaxID=80249 RepID=A0A9P0DRF5_PHACE|nr:unnamed protein product [Phaedon cochleariae]